MKLGLISDTHGFLDPRLPKIFRGVDHIFHAGDIGPDRLLAQLESIAPVTAVLGNTDSSNWIRLTETLTLGGRKFLIHHIVSPHSLTAELEAQIKRDIGITAKVTLLPFGTLPRTEGKTRRVIRKDKP